MARVSRTRTRNLAYAGPGTNNWVRTNGSSPGGETYPQQLVAEESCSDFVGTPWADSSLNLFRSKYPQTTCSGSYSSSGWNYVYANVPLNVAPSTYLRRPWTNASMTHPSPIPTAVLAQMAIANANPNRPVIDLPVSILELRELPSLLRDAGRIANGGPARGSARANLMAQFGILPIISDIQKLLNFAEQVARREQYLRELSSGMKRIKRSITDESWTGQSTHIAWPTWVSQSGSLAQINLQATRKYWYTVRARLQFALSEREIQSHAWKIVLGLDTPSIAAAWELLPWSWLIDWFSTTGTLLHAHRGGIPWSYEGLCVMHETKYNQVVTFPNKESHINPTPSSPQGYTVVKTRAVVPLVWSLPLFYSPYLTSRQLSILASLFVLRV
jgi:hypothetical protein